MLLRQHASRVGWLALAAILVTALAFGVDRLARRGERLDGLTSEAHAASRTPTGAATGDALFTAAGCGSCHTLAAAQSRGQTGPDLDALRPSAQAVARQLRTGGGGMPSFRARLTKSQIETLAAFVARESRGGGLSSLRFVPDGTKLTDCNGTDIVCYRQAFGNLAFRNGPRPALALVDRAAASNVVVKEACHTLAHAVGHAALERYHGNVGVAFARGAPGCGSGYYHGLLEQALFRSSGRSVIGKARRLCATIRAPFLHYQCVHGLGHGLMIYTRHELPSALRLCHRLRPQDRITCTGGVFMENIVWQDPAGGRSRWLKDDDLLYPCDAVANRDKYFCYDIVTSRILPAVGWDWTKAAAVCQQSERAWVQVCFESYGRDAAGWARHDPVGTLDLCRLAGSGEASCVVGAAKEFVNNTAGAKEASVFCRAAPAYVRPSCFWTIGELVRALVPAPAGRRRVCTARAGLYAAACIDGVEGRPLRP